MYMLNKKKFLIFVTFLVGMCSIIYELLISTASSYFLGNSVRQFSLIIGFYMAFMGLGAYLSKLFKEQLIYYFILIELWLGIIGAFSVPLCYTYFLYADYDGFQLFVFILIAAIGMLTGLEVPLLTRILEDDFSLKDNISNILTFDYLGALIATIAFPVLLVPFVGIFKSSLFFGLLNIAVGLATFLFFRREIALPQLKRRILLTIIFALIAIIVFSIFAAQSFMERWHNGIFKHPVIYSEQSPYQDITMTKTNHEFRLYLNGAIQFSSRDEYRYHEALVHLAMMQHPDPQKVLLLGGGEGLALREVLKYPIEQVDLVDIDPAITQLAAQMDLIRQLNENALASEKVQLIHEDAFTYLLNYTDQYDLIICDLPDPNSESLAKLYSNAFYQIARSKLSGKGLLVTQATSPTLTPQAFWSIHKTLSISGFTHCYPYHVDVPSFGNWGFVLATGQPIDFQYNADIPTRFLESDLLQHWFYFPKDTRLVEVEANYLDQPVLLDYYLDHWHQLNHEAK
ncbi:MAG: polyamine aminopropyltransferase [Bacteroidota bacterium]